MFTAFFSYKHPPVAWRGILITALSDYSNKYCTLAALALAARHVAKCEDIWLVAKDL